MILYVDLEHASTYTKPRTDWLLASRTRITYRLQDLVGDVCLLQRYPDVTPELIECHDIRAVFISGNGAPKDLYDPADQAGLARVVLDGTIPVFGFCGGFQFVGETLGVPLERIGRLAADDVDEHPDYQPGWRKELGYAPVEVMGTHPLLEGLGEAPVFRHAHTWELKALPAGFDNYARTDVTELQLVAHEERPLAGAQFHPEYWTDEHPAGRRLLENFCAWAGLR